MGAAVCLWVAGDALGISAVTTAMMGLCVLLGSGVLAWRECLTYPAAWDTLFWFAGECMRAHVCVSGAAGGGARSASRADVVAAKGSPAAVTHFMHFLASMPPCLPPSLNHPCPLPHCPFLCRLLQCWWACLGSSTASASSHTLPTVSARLAAAAECRCCCAVQLKSQKLRVAAASHPGQAPRNLNSCMSPESAAPAPAAPPPLPLLQWWATSLWPPTWGGPWCLACSTLSTTCCTTCLPLRWALPVATAAAC